MKKGTHRYTHHQISCLGCMNLLMCGRDIRNKVHVKCCQDVLDHGRLILLEDILDKKYGERGCAMLATMREKGAEPWERYVQEIRKNFCEN